MAWTDNRVKLLKKLWQAGLSGSKIAELLGGVSRNAVISKVHRLGLSDHARLPRIKSHRQRMAAKRMTKLRCAAIGNPALGALYNAETDACSPPTEELVIPIAERKSIHTLTESSCRWPIGDPQNPDFHFCGKSKVPGLPYCEFHARRAFQPPKTRRRECAVSEPAQAALAPTTESKAIATY